jgi:hypothetical protein
MKRIITSLILIGRAVSASENVELVVSDPVARYATEAEMSDLVLPEGTIVINQDDWTLVVHDGTTPGGREPDYSALYAAKAQYGTSGTTNTIAGDLLITPAKIISIGDYYEDSFPCAAEQGGVALGSGTKAGIHALAAGFQAEAGDFGAAVGDTVIVGDYALGGGVQNNAGDYSMVSGREMDVGNYGFASGLKGSGGDGSFIFSDSQYVDFNRSAHTNAFSVRASGGTYFDTPELEVTGTVTATAFTLNTNTITATATNFVFTIGTNTWTLGL